MVDNDGRIWLSGVLATGVLFGTIGTVILAWGHNSEGMVVLVPFTVVCAMFSWLIGWVE